MSSPHPQPGSGPSGSSPRRSNPPPVPRSALFTFFPPRTVSQTEQHAADTVALPALDAPPSGAPPSDDSSSHDEAAASDRPPPLPNDAASHSAPPNLNIPFPPMFVMRPDGSIGLGHHFFPSQAPAPSDDASSTATQPSDNGAPPPQSPNPFPFLSPHFHFVVNLPPPDAQPDPAKAAELLKSLPDINRGLLKRVDRIVAAEENESDEDERGWKCGICLEGMQEEDGDIDIKGLPCNHLFHAKCLEPWFATKHNCPTCRLDLDPLRTLSNSEDSRRNPLRPSQTGADRPDNSRPYNRPSNAARPTLPNMDSFTVIWRMVTPQTQSNMAQVDATPPVPQAASTDQGATAPDPLRTPLASPTPTAATLPAHPRPMFGSFMHTSPIPMERSISAPPPPLASESAPSGSLESARPVPERRQHITLIRQGGPAQVMHGGTQLHPSANPLHHHHIVTHHHHHHHHHHPVQQPSRTPTPTPPPPPALPVEQPTIHVFINHGPGPNGPQAPPDPAAEPKKSTFVPQSLESWAEVREKALGWRCDAPECALAPSNEWDGDAEMSPLDGPQDNKEMLSIYAPSQTAQLEATSGKEFVRLSCPHRWHRTCLETLERVSGRTDLAGDEQGRLSVRCALCRKDGWVKAASREAVANVPTM